MKELEREIAQIRRALRRSSRRISRSTAARRWQILGLGPGPHVGEALRHLLDRVLEDPALNAPGALEAELRRWWGGRARACSALMILGGASPCRAACSASRGRRFRERVKALLEQEGFAVDLTGPGLEGIARALTLPPNLVLADVHLPDIEGYESHGAAQA